MFLLDAPHSAVAIRLLPPDHPAVRVHAAPGVPPRGVPPVRIPSLAEQIVALAGAMRAVFIPPVASLHDRTRERVLAAVSASPEPSPKIARRARLSGCTVRRCLSELVASGEVVCRQLPMSGRASRQIAHYFLSEE